MPKESIHFDVVVIGAGAMGGATLYNLAKRGVKACGLEQFGIAHNRGSSHGDTRIIRKAYFEHPDYVPLLNRSYELWGELEAESGRELMINNGLIVAGKPESDTIVSLKLCYQKYDIAHECWSVSETADHFPQFRIPAEYEVFFDPFGGFLYVEKCVDQHLKLAQSLGAHLHIHEEALGWKKEGDAFKISTSNLTLFANKLIITMGAWSKKVLEPIGVKLEIWQKEVLWFDGMDMPNFQPVNFPVYFIETDYGNFYGFPAINEKGAKIAEHTRPNVIDSADDLGLSTEPKDEPDALRFLSEYIPGIGRNRTNFAVCMYTKTVDDNFILDIHPEDSDIVIGAGFSGHGFKFSPVVGEILVDLALEGDTKLPIDFLRIGRFL